jgi:glycosyltransferase involved in cell wall biosynthesis
MADDANLEGARVAISHEWLVSIGGSERCVAIFSRLFPNALIYTSIHKPEITGGLVPRERVRASFLDKFPSFLRNRHRHLLILMPSAFESFKLHDIDLVISSSHCAAKGIRKPPGAKHICYCYSPMRYVWDMYDLYLSGMKGVTRTLFQQAAPGLREWDKRTAANVDLFIAISGFIADRIKRIYNRDSVVVYPPVDCSAFTIDENTPREEHFLVLSRLVGYKRVDIAIEAFRNLPYKLRVVGTGPQLDELKSKAPPNVEFAGFVPDDELPNEYRRARAVIATALEDFGLVPVEAAACGTPSIAFRAGGYLETVREGVSGVFFPDQTPGSVMSAVARFTSIQFNPIKIREIALPFDVSHFKRQILDYAARTLGGLTM